MEEKKWVISTQKIETEYTADNLKEVEPTALSWFHFPTVDLKIDNKAPLPKRREIFQY